MGHRWTPKRCDRRLATGQYELHPMHPTETLSCITDIAAVMAVVRQFRRGHLDRRHSQLVQRPAIKKDELGIDIMITGTQKGTCAAAGLSLCSVSKRALARAATVTERGYYLDLVEFQTNHERA